MIVDLTETDASAIGSALLDARRRSGVAGAGMVLTFVIVVEERGAHDAARSATEAAREHPARILVVIPRGARGDSRLDAEVRVGDGLAETVVMRLYGPLAGHADSVLLPLLLPDAPVVAWWPGAAPPDPSADSVGRLAQRRITDAAADARPMHALIRRATTYAAGDTDLAWARITRWRTVLAAALDAPYDPIASGEVTSVRSSPSAELLAAWLELRLGVPVTRKASRGPGITGVRLRTKAGGTEVGGTEVGGTKAGGTESGGTESGGTTSSDIVLHRSDGRLATLSRRGEPDRLVALRQRDEPDILAEELRRLDPDEVYAEVLATVPGRATARDDAPRDGAPHDGQATRTSTA